MAIDRPELRDLIQRICLKHIFYGYRRVTAKANDVLEKNTTHRGADVVICRIRR